MDMKACEFVKEFGWDGAKRVIKLTIGESWADHYDIKEDSIGTAGTIYSKKLCEHNENFVCLRELKRLVESHELVKSLDGIHEARHELLNRHIGFSRYTEIKQAIADVESCQ